MTTGTRCNDATTEDTPLRHLIARYLSTHWNPSADPPARTFVAAESVNWTALTALAGTEGVAPLLYNAVRGRGTVPPAIEAALQQAYDASRAQGSVRLAQLEAILHRLNAAETPAVLLKGAALSVTVYADPALRPMSDVDLLVAREAIPAIVEMLRPIGFDYDGVEMRAGATLRFGNELPLARARWPGGRVDVHWHLFHSPYYQAQDTLAWFRQHTQPIALGQATVVVLKPEAQLLHLCGHCWLHHRARPKLIWQHDIAALLAHAREVMDWDLVIDQAQQCDLVLPLQRTLASLAVDWRLPVSQAILERVAASTPSTAEYRYDARQSFAGRTTAARILVNLAEMQGWRARLDCAWTYLFPSAAYMRQRYAIGATRLLPFYYPVRWFGGLQHTRPAA